MSKTAMYISNRRSRARQAKRRQFGGIIIGVGTFVIAFFGLSQYAKAPLTSRSSTTIAAMPAPKYSTTLTWPHDAISGAVGIKGEGVAASYKSDIQRPTASIAKIITALAILEKHPLKAGEGGPVIPITSKDEDLYREYFYKNGSVVPVKAGQQLRLRQALQAMILPSANNIADTAAIWAFGSLEAYKEYANSMVARMGLNHTVIGNDASGFDPQTKSTAEDLVRLGEIALDVPALAEIARQKAFTIPGFGVFPNYNQLVTDLGYTGLKPGNTDEAGGTILFSKKIILDNKPKTLIGVILGTKSGDTPYQTAQIIADSAESAIKASY